MEKRGEQIKKNCAACLKLGEQVSIYPVYEEEFPADTFLFETVAESPGGLSAIRKCAVCGRYYYYVYRAQYDGSEMNDTAHLYALQRGDEQLMESLLELPGNVLKSICLMMDKDIHYLHGPSLVTASLLRIIENIPATSGDAEVILTAKKFLFQFVAGNTALAALVLKIIEEIGFDENSPDFMIKTGRLSYVYKKNPEILDVINRCNSELIK